MREATSEQSAGVPQLSADGLIQRRIEGLETWLKENCPECVEEQRHLDEGTVERQYWHYGYLVALRDMKKLLGLDDQSLN
jgi:hypothetical protein